MAAMRNLEIAATVTNSLNVFLFIWYVVRESTSNNTGFLSNGLMMFLCLFPPITLIAMVWCIFSPEKCKQFFLSGILGALLLAAFIMAFVGLGFQIADWSTGDNDTDWQVTRDLVLGIPSIALTIIIGFAFVIENWKTRRSYYVY